MSKRTLHGFVALAAFCIQPWLPMPDARADGLRMTELCGRSHRDLVSIYVEGALDNANQNAGKIVLQLQQALEEGSLETDGLKKAWKLVQPYCLPSHFALDRAVDAFCDFLVLNPRNRAGDSAALLDEALRRAWPCHGDARGQSVDK